MTLKKMLIAIYILAVSLFGSARAIHAQSPAPSNLQVQIKKVDYKELKAGKHQILVLWDADEIKSCGKDCRITKVSLDIELTDAKGEKRRATRTLSAGGGSGKVAITPIPIPKDLIVAVAKTKIFDGNPGSIPDSLRLLKFKVTLTATAIYRSFEGGGGVGRAITGVARKEGALRADAISSP
jgi:hypothetical protein